MVVYICCIHIYILCYITRKLVAMFWGKTLWFTISDLRQKSLLCSLRSTLNYHINY